MKKFYGTGVALITPFTEEGNVDYPALRKLLSHTENSVDYFVVMGTTGESATVSATEKKEILDAIIKNNTHNLPLVYGLGGNHTQHVLDLIHNMDFTGIDALLSVSPYYVKPSQEGIYLHFKALADASPVPIILYNVPGRTASNISADTTLRLAGHRNIIGIKEASGNIEQCMKIAQNAPKDFLLISGDDLLTLPLYSIGAKGVISVLANAVPGIFKNIKEYALLGRYEEARTEVFKILNINGLMYEEGSPVGIKYLLSLMGIAGFHTRLPHAPPSEALREKIKALYKRDLEK